jgi:hypothetical protein
MTCRYEIRHTIFVSNRLADGDGSLLIRILEHEDLSEFYSEPAMC